MSTIRTLATDFFHVPLPVTLTDSTHGVDGRAVAPDRPGHGVEFDWEALEPLRVR